MILLTCVLFEFSKMEDKEKLVVEKFKLDGLYEYQKKVLEELINGKCAFVCQRTGKGKSICYEAFTTALNSKEAIVIVVSPLIAIMEEQVKHLNSLGITAVMLAKDKKEEMDAKTGKFQYIFGSPEILLGRDDWRSTLKTKLFQNRIKLIAIDEAHLVIKWYVYINFVIRVYYTYKLHDYIFCLHFNIKISRAVLNNISH